VELLRAILDAAPDQPDALHQLCVLAFRVGDLPAAIRLVEQAIAHDAGSALFWRDLSTLYERIGFFDEAVTAGQPATELDPGDPYAHHSLGAAYYRLLRIDEAVACARQALILDPMLPAAHFAVAEALLVQGEFAPGWEEYEWRFQMPDAVPLLPKTDKPHWDGVPTADGRLLLIADQGFGDVIQFSRYIPWARERCPDLMLACGGEMFSLLKHNFP
jgi:tetratricopeptide (TPR) repeat protein